MERRLTVILTADVVGYPTGNRNWLSGESLLRLPPQIAKKGQ